jgi:hypothetical protein
MDYHHFLREGRLPQIETEIENSPLEREAIKGEVTERLGLAIETLSEEVSQLILDNLFGKQEIPDGALSNPDIALDVLARLQVGQPFTKIQELMALIHSNQCTNLHTKSLIGFDITPNDIGALTNIHSEIEALLFLSRYKEKPSPKISPATAMWQTFPDIENRASRTRYNRVIRAARFGTPEWMPVYDIDILNQFGLSPGSGVIQPAGILSYPMIIDNFWEITGEKLHTDTQKSIYSTILIPIYFSRNKNGVVKPQFTMKRVWAQEDEQRLQLIIQRIDFHTSRTWQRVQRNIHNPIRLERPR